MLLSGQFSRAEAAFELGKDDKERKSKLLHTLCQARAVLGAYDQQWQEEIRALIWLVRTWAGHKQENRMGWLQALHTVVCGTKSDLASGSLPFYAFPNELLKAIVERTGGRPVQLAVPKVSEGTGRNRRRGPLLPCRTGRRWRRSDVHQGNLPDGGDAGRSGCL